MPARDEAAGARCADYILKESERRKPWPLTDIHHTSAISPKRMSAAPARAGWPEVVKTSSNANRFNRSAS